MTFQPPTLEQVKAYVREKNLTVDPEWFFNYFEAGDWIDSLGNPVKSWKQKLWTHHRINFEKKGGGNGKTKLYPIKGKFCAEIRNNHRCGMPAVYKSGGTYDHYYCADCMPAKVKEKYE